MRNSVSFFNNYMAAADILTIFVCIVIIILMTVSYIKKEQNFIIFRRMPFILIIAAQADLLYHLVFAGGDGFSPAACITYLVAYGGFIISLYMFMAYIRATVWKEDFQWFRMRYVIRVTIALSVAVMAALPLIAGKTHLSYEHYVFTGIYTLNMVLLLVMLYRSRGHVFGRIYAGVCGSAVLSLLLMYTQLIFRQTSYTAATYLFMPPFTVWFGILHFLACAMLLTHAMRRAFDRIQPVVGMAVFFILFALTYNLRNRTLGFFTIALMRLPDALFQYKWLSFIGFLSKDFTSGDYFPLIPFLFLFWFGYYLWKWIAARGWDTAFTRKIPVLDLIGRHSLLIYLVHQPLLYGICWLLFGGVS